MSHRFSHFRQSSVGPGFQLAFGSQQAAPAHLVNRINEKKIELENLKQLRDLSANLAKQLRELEGKLSTLTNGTEVVATVLANWHNVLRAISLASAHLAAVPKEPKEPEGEDQEGHLESQVYPEMLVRIPTKFHDEKEQREAAEKEAQRESSYQE
ncbi:hypothetical protein TWF694_001653 [Orbilia ellipsospora]|uniref:DASH complex subunit DAD2 n=1 Tax=Orbilia ellipsospora TaxID=2528407 RepID=A0AAV9X4C0_9PEZI